MQPNQKLSLTALEPKYAMLVLLRMQSDKASDLNVEAELDRLRMTNYREYSEQQKRKRVGRTTVGTNASSGRKNSSSTKLF